MTAVIDWNGKDLPANLQGLPPGRYVVENLDEADDLSSDQQEGIRAALQAIDEGKALPAEDVDAEIADLLRCSSLVSFSPGAELTRSSTMVGARASSPAEGAPPTQVRTRVRGV